MEVPIPTADDGMRALFRLPTKERASFQWARDIVDLSRDGGDEAGAAGANLDLLLPDAQALGPSIVARRGAFDFVKVPGDGSCFFSPAWLLGAKPSA